MNARGRRTMRRRHLRLRLPIHEATGFQRGSTVALPITFGRSWVTPTVGPDISIGTVENGEVVGLETYPKGSHAHDS
jgi:hypothetical protein